MQFGNMSLSNSNSMSSADVRTQPRDGAPSRTCQNSNALGGQAGLRANGAQAPGRLSPCTVQNICPSPDGPPRTYIAQNDEIMMLGHRVSLGTFFETENAALCMI